MHYAGFTMKQSLSIFTIFFFTWLLNGCALSVNQRNELERPIWIDQEHSSYVSAEYLSAVGEGTNRTLSSRQAMANLAEMFSVTVRSQTKVLSETIKEESRLGVTSESKTSLQTSINTRTEQSIQGIEIKESWLSPNGIYYTLAVLDRKKATQNLMELIMALDSETAELIHYSHHLAPNVILSLNALRTARDHQINREMFNTQLKYISGSGLINDLSRSSIEAMIRQRLAETVIKVKGHDTVLQAAVATLGMTLANQSDVEIQSSVELTEPTFIHDWYWLRGSYQLIIWDNGNVISRKRWPIKVSSKQVELLDPRWKDKLNNHITLYLQQLIADAPTL